MGSMLSIEALFWVPLGMDLMLLVGTYSACKLSGLKWYLDEMKKHSEQKKNENDDEVIAQPVENNSHLIHSVWELAMIAYSAYDCLLPWATYICYNHPSLHVSLSWAMTMLMTAKLTSPNTWKWTNINGQKGKTLEIIFFYLPTYIRGLCSVQKLLFLLNKTNDLTPIYYPELRAIWYTKLDVLKIRMVDQRHQIIYQYSKKTQKKFTILHKKIQNTKTTVTTIMIS